MSEITQLLLENIDELRVELIKLRRMFHQYPETAWTEFVTTARIIEYLQKYHIPYQLGKDFISKNNCYGREKQAIEQAKQRAKEEGVSKLLLEEMEEVTGAVALLDTGKRGSTIILRFDIDGLAQSESQAENHIPFQENFNSQRQGYMHACGHDGHIAMGLVLARFLWEHKEEFSGMIKIIFQPAEEGVMGGYAFSQSDILKGADYFLSGHLGMGNQTGEIVLGTYGFLATTKLDLTFQGKSSHAGAAPEQGNNALLAACSAVLAMQSFCQDGRGASRLNVGEMSAGNGRNVIPDHALLRLETRGETTEIEQLITKKVKTCVQGAAKMYGCTYKTTIMGKAKSAVSDRDFAEKMQKYLTGHSYWKQKKNEKKLQFYKERKFTGSEDVTYYMNEIQKQKGKALYLGIGADIQAPHHNGSFDFDETALQIGIEIYILILSELSYSNEM